jgi:hypothetical protein
MSDLYHIRLGTTYTAVFEFFKKVKNVSSYCEVSIHNDYPPMGQGIWKISPELKKLLSKVDYFNIQGDESLSELLWIVYHLAKNNSVLAFANLNHEKQSFIAEGYYKNKLQKLSFNNYQILPKIMSDDENQQNGVSFCIPTGGDSPQLRKCVERILSFKTPKEIILSGSVSDDFPYKDQVKIVGEDIPYPPIRISEKKNVAIEAAKYSLACVLHDRVLLPKNIDELFIDLAPVPVMAIAGLFDLTGDWSLVGRYSDFGTSVKKELSPKVQFLSHNKPSYSFSKELWHVYCRTHNLSFGDEVIKKFGHTYVTGSFFIISKQSFMNEKLDTDIVWNNFEDVEWGVRCSRKLIPHIFNTDYMHLTQSIRAIIILPPKIDSNQKSLFANITDLNSGVQITKEHILAHKSFRSKCEFAYKTTFESDLQYFTEKCITFFKKYNAPAHQVYEAEKLLLNHNRQGFIENFKRLIIKVCPVNYNEDFVIDLEKLIGEPLEILELKDTMIQSKYFTEFFSFSTRLLNNVTLLRWFRLFTDNLILRKVDEKNTVEVEKRREMYVNSVIQCNYLNDSFNVRYDPEKWLEIFQNLED